MKEDYMDASNLPDLPVTPSPIEPAKQSKLGIASFVLGICAVLGFIVFFIVVLYGSSIFGSNTDFTDPSFLQEAGSITAVLWMMCGWFISPMIGLVGLGLGIPAVIQKKAKKTFGIIGLVMNALTLLPYCALLAFILWLSIGNGG